MFGTRLRVSLTLNDPFINDKCLNKKYHEKITIANTIIYIFIFFPLKLFSLLKKFDYKNCPFFFFLHIETNWKVKIGVNGFNRGVKSEISFLRRKSELTRGGICQFLRGRISLESSDGKFKALRGSSEEHRSIELLGESRNDRSIDSGPESKLSAFNGVIVTFETRKERGNVSFEKFDDSRNKYV